MNMFPALTSSNPFFNQKMMLMAMIDRLRIKAKKQMVEDERRRLIEQFWASMTTTEGMTSAPELETTKFDSLDSTTDIQEPDSTTFQPITKSAFYRMTMASEQAAVFQAQSNRLVLAVTLPIVGAILAFALLAYLYWLRRHKSGYNLPQPASPEPFYSGYSRRETFGGGPSFSTNSQKSRATINTVSCSDNDVRIKL